MQVQKNQQYRVTETLFRLHLWKKKRKVSEYHVTSEYSSKRYFNHRGYLSPSEDLQRQKVTAWEKNIRIKSWGIHYFPSYRKILNDIAEFYKAVPDNRAFDLAALIEIAGPFLYPLIKQQSWNKTVYFWNVNTTRPPFSQHLYFPTTSSSRLFN